MQQGVAVCYMFLMTPPVLSKWKGWVLLAGVVCLFSMPLWGLLSDIFPLLLVGGALAVGLSPQRKSDHE